MIDARNSFFGQHKAKFNRIFAGGLAALFSTISAAQTLPAPCKTMYFGTAKLACLQPGPGGIVTNLKGTDSSSIPPATQWCQAITPGTIAPATTPAPGTMACYQFTVQDLTNLNVQTAFPTGIVGSAELYNINSNTSGFKLAESFYPNNPMSTTYTTQFIRAVLVVKTTNGAGGAPMNIGVNAPTATPIPATNTLANAISMAINDTVYGKIATPLTSAYYFYPLKIGQAKAAIRATFTLNQQVAYSFAQQTGPGTYNTQPEIVFTPAQSGKNIAATSPYPANTSTTTTPAGVLIRVSGINSSAPANEAFTARVGIADATISSYNIENTETISRWYPVSPAQLQAATYITSTAQVTDSSGAPVRDQDITVTVNRNTSVNGSVQVSTLRTDNSGRISITTQMPACSGTVFVQNNYGPPGSPTDHWDGTAQRAAVVFNLPDVVPAETRTQIFTRICKETYRGYY